MHLIFQDSLYTSPNIDSSPLFYMKTIIMSIIHFEFHILFYFHLFFPQKHLKKTKTPQKQ